MLTKKKKKVLKQATLFVDFFKIKMKFAGNYKRLQFERHLVLPHQDGGTTRIAEVLFKKEQWTTFFRSKFLFQ